MIPSLPPPTRDGRVGAPVRSGFCTRTLECGGLTPLFGRQSKALTSQRTPNSVPLRVRLLKLIDSELLHRLHQHTSEWRVVIDNSFETKGSVIVFGTRGNQAVVLKVIKRPGDEWHSGKVLQAFDGVGFARVYESAPGAVLMERLRPGNSLVKLALNGQDERATDIFADVISQLISVQPSLPAAESSIASTEPETSPVEISTRLHRSTVYDWARGFERYVATGDDQIPGHLVEAGQQLFLKLCASQREPRLLHGDLQHYNVLFDSARGWLAIDPKGVIGEAEYETGAVLRNPFERPELFLSRPTIERRLKQFASRLTFDFERMLAWAFAQAVLSAIWEIEDGFAVNATNPALRLAEAIQPMLSEFR